MLIKIYEFLRFISSFRRFDKFFSKSLSTNKNNSLTNIYKQKQIYEENANFITGKFYPCNKCEYYKYI